MKRQEWLGLLAKAEAGELMSCWTSANLSPNYTELRPPEIGSVMVRGRMGGNGDAFNLGEMTVSRCSVRLSCGTVGHGYIKGRSKQAALHVALCDALLQTTDAPIVISKILSVLADKRDVAVAAIAGKAAATKVDFFTLVRGED